MPRLVTRLCLFLFLCGSFSLSVRAEDNPPKPILTADAVQEAFVRVAAKIKPSVVTIYAEKIASKTPRPAAPAPENPEDKDKKEEAPQGDDDDDAPFPYGPLDPDARRTSLGTGMIVSADGDILTNYHVVRDAGIIRVSLSSDDEQSPRPLAHVVAFDEESDLAVVRIVPRPGLGQLKPVEFADSDNVRIGQWAIAIGAPFDQAQTVTVGIISAKARHLDKDGKLSLQDYIQTDASINPGNSGGPLIDLDGKVIGINTAILSPSRFNVGIGFSVPSNTVRDYLPLLREGKTVARGFLGIQYTALDQEVAREFSINGGMQIGALAKRGDVFIGPAKEAGIQAGDIITHVNGKEVESSDEFRRSVAGKAPGTKIKFGVLRPGMTASEKREFEVILGDWNSQAGETPKTPVAAPEVIITGTGVQVEDIEKLSADEVALFGVTPGEKGAIITDITPASPADDAGLVRGVRITRVRVGEGAWRNIENKKAMDAVEEALPSEAHLLMQVHDRSGAGLYKVIIMPKK